ncbi:MAG: indolepyruvate ferredoxin oxidoreductase family protein [Ectothiorhodospiraceae bacterium]|nr:indolepyruvate ferredoxin oxidoreductase family protein [Ectothiorhodospiraceae bacterium]
MAARMAAQRLDYQLSDRMTVEDGWVYMTGMQALVRLPVQQRKRDQAAGLNTGGYISGYRGSPLGRYDMELWAEEERLRSHTIVFQPGVNEDLAATATWGSQMVGLLPGAKVDGVFSIWYGKAPGMDRSMDAIRHSNLQGTNPHGGSLLLVGDDHGAKSSTLACYSDYNFVSAGMPLLAPANPQEVLDYGLHGIALSRYSGTVVGLKLVTDVIEGGGTVRVSPDSPTIVYPEARRRHELRVFTPMLDQERSLYEDRLHQVLDYARVNALNTISGSDSARLGIISAGKASQDLAQALAAMGYRDGRLGDLDVRVLKVGMVWPLDAGIVQAFAQGLDAIVVVEEKRPLLEDQVRSILYESERRPRLVGKRFHGPLYGDYAAVSAFPNHGELDPNLIARVLARVAEEIAPGSGVTAPEPSSRPLMASGGAQRMPSFCAGCPHGRSTQVIEGSRALAGIGCHSMAMLRDPVRTNSISQMGGEGIAWLGQQPFTEETHVFTNMGDGTYFHSGLMAIRAAVAARVPITYKLLHNGFVSMTGGQPVDGELSPSMMIRQLQAEGVTRIALVTDEPENYRGQTFGEGVTLHPRQELETVQRTLREVPDVTVLIYDQPCATERRRLRKRGKWEDPDRRVYINPDVCEGCGDCSTVSQCMAIEPLETPFGRKRVINQSSCNKDFSCLEGFCPSLVTVSGARPRTARTAEAVIDVGHVPLPATPAVAGCWSVLVSGIGGAGVVTVGQTLAMAAHVDGYFSSNLDITGLAQKYGAVHSHIKMAASTEAMRSTRIAAGEADALIGCDLVVAAGDEALSKLAADRAVAVTDTTVVPTAEFSRNPDWRLDGDAQRQRLETVLGQRVCALPAQLLAERVMGDRVYANMVLVGASWQQGGIPLSLEAIHRAIELNGVQVERNKQAFALGRLAQFDPDGARRLMGEERKPVAIPVHRAQTPEQLVEHRAGALTEYQDAAYARRYTDTVARVRDAGLDQRAVTAVASGYYKLLAVKDPWEVARLYSRPAFRAALREAFEGELKLRFHIGAWPFGRTDRATGKAVKGEAGEWMLTVFRLMSRMRRLRGTVLDPFRNNAEARLARKALADYEADIDFALEHWSEERADAICRLLELPGQLRGFGHVRQRHQEQVQRQRADLRAEILAPAVRAA